MSACIICYRSANLWPVMESPTTAEVPRAGPPRYTWISREREFRSMVEMLRAARRMALDIEADSLYHYFDKVCLIQISTDAETFVVDPLALSDLSALGPILAHPGVEKVFHAAGYDILCLRRDYGFLFANIFDTHIAGQLIGYEFLGLGALMERLLGIAHSKRRQRDDWSRRPLNTEQLEYAAMDTHHLLQLRDVLEQQLTSADRKSWAEEEFEAIAASRPEAREFDPDGYRRIKGSRDLTPRELAMLRTLYHLREKYAQEMDLPPFKVLNNPVLVDLVQHPPRTSRELFHRRGIAYRIARRYGTEMFLALKSAQAEVLPPNQFSASKSWKPPSPEIKLRLERLRAWRCAKARELHLPVGVVFPGNLLENLAISPPSEVAAMEALEGMRRWRIREFGGEILKILNDT